MTNALAAALASYSPSPFFARVLNFPVTITPGELAEGDRVEARINARKSAIGTVLKASDKQVRFEHEDGVARVNASQAKARHLSLMVKRVSGYDGLEGAAQALGHGELGRAVQVHVERSRQAYEAGDVEQSIQQLVVLSILARMALGGAPERMELLADVLIRKMGEFMSDEDLASARGALTAKMTRTLAA